MAQNLLISIITGGNYCIFMGDNGFPVFDYSVQRGDSLSAILLEQGAAETSAEAGRLSRSIAKQNGLPVYDLQQWSDITKTDPEAIQDRIGRRYGKTPPNINFINIRRGDRVVSDGETIKIIPNTGKLPSSSRFSLPASADFLPVDMGIFDEIPSNFPGRSGYSRKIDQKFESTTLDVLRSQPDSSNTLFIVDTGHSIAAGTVLAENGFLPAIYMPEGTFGTSSKTRLFSQIIDYDDRLVAAIANHSGNPRGYAILLEAHRDKPLDSSVFPSVEQLRSRGITRVVLLSEARLGPLDILSHDGGGTVHNYLRQLNADGITVKAFGIDPRSTTEVKKHPKSFLEEELDRLIDPEIHAPSTRNPTQLEPGETYYQHRGSYHDFRYYHRSWQKSGPTVEIAQGAVVVSKKQLQTGGLASCGAIAFTFGGKNLLGHIDATTPKSRIIDTIRDNFDIEAMKRDKDFKIVVWEGSLWATRHAIEIIMSSLDSLGLLDHMVYAGSSNFMGTVGVNQTGTFDESQSTDLKR